jgi:hypothetical protein
LVGTAYASASTKPKCTQKILRFIYHLYKWIEITREEDDNLQHNNVCLSGCEKVRTKYRNIILSFWKDSKVQNLHKVCKTMKNYQLLQRNQLRNTHTRAHAHAHTETRQFRKQTCIVSVSMIRLRRSLILSASNDSILSVPLPSFEFKELYFS